MKKEELQALGLTDEQISKVFELNGKDIKAEQRKTEKAEQERDQYKERAESAEETLKGFDGVDVDGLNKQITEWKTKAEQAEKDYQQKIYDRDFADALKTELDEIKFSSEAAKKAVTADIKEAGLKLKDGKILGLGDLIKQIRESDASAFAEDENGTPPARFTQPKKKAGDKPMTREDILKIKDSTERQAAIASNIELFNGKDDE